MIILWYILQQHHIVRSLWNLPKQHSYIILASFTVYIYILHTMIASNPSPSYHHIPIRFPLDSHFTLVPVAEIRTLMFQHCNQNWLLKGRGLGDRIEVSQDKVHALVWVKVAGKWMCWIGKIWKLETIGFSLRYQIGMGVPIEILAPLRLHYVKALKNDPL